MRVFISWSKPLSAELARVLRTWLPEVIQTLDPWMSKEDIAKGQRWGVEVSSQLETTGQGLICVTAENFTEPWLNFEAGALAKSLSEARVRPVLLGVQPHEVTGPLSQFQATSATDHDDMLRLVKSLNEALDPPLDSSRLTRAFERAWPDFLKPTEELLRKPPAPGGSDPLRKPDELLAEILERVRGLERHFGERRLPSSRRLGGQIRNDHHFTVGQRVRHAAFGTGVITATSGGDADDRDVLVAFDDVGDKRLISRYAPMDPVESEDV